MKFKELFNDKIKDLCLPENYKLTDAFIKQVQGLDSDHYDSIIATIISVQTNNAINEDGHNQGEGQPYKHEPLLGLYKSHCIDASRRSVHMNMKLGKEGIKIIEGLDGDSDINFTPKMEKELLKEMDEAIAQGTFSKDDVEQFAREKTKSLLANYRENRKNNCLNGNWVVFGKRAGENIFLYTHISFEHSKDEDPKIYQQLVDMYSQEFISELKSGK